jgi:hypothetical protein
VYALTVSTTSTFYLLVQTKSHSWYRHCSVCSYWTSHCTCDCVLQLYVLQVRKKGRPFPLLVMSLTPSFPQIHPPNRTNIFSCFLLHFSTSPNVIFFFLPRRLLAAVPGTRRCAVNAEGMFASPTSATTKTRRDPAPRCKRITGWISKIHSGSSSH